MPPSSELLFVAGGGALGSLIRYGLSLLSLRFFGGTTLVGTFVANVVGCFAIGLLTAILVAHPDWLAPRTIIGLRVGLLGGLTTFSTFAAESVLLAGQARFGGMTLYVTSTVVLGILAVYAGTWIAGAPQESAR